MSDPTLSGIDIKNKMAWVWTTLKHWGSILRKLSIKSEKESGWLETSDADMAWKVGLEILEYCTELDVHEKSNCMQFLFQTNLLFAWALNKYYESIHFLC